MLITWMITFSAIFVLVVFYPLPTLASAYQGFVSRLVTSTPARVSGLAHCHRFYLSIEIITSSGLGGHRQ
jgi:hypothetical protein